MPEVQQHRLHTINLETAITFPLYVLHVLLQEPVAAQTLTKGMFLPCS